MADRVVTPPSLTPVASPLNYYAAPVRQTAAPVTSSMSAVARTLEKLNPALQTYVENRFNDTVQRDMAEGALAADQISATKALAKNKEGWDRLVEQERERDRANGTDNASRLAAASPHFQRGLYKARAQRLGMMLNDRLANDYANNPLVEVNGQQVHLHDSRDPQAVGAWLQQSTASFTQEYGLDQIDPVLVAEVFQPLAAKAQGNISSYHGQQQLERVKAQYADEVSATAGMVLAGAAPKGDGFEAAGMAVAATTAMERFVSLSGHDPKVTSAFRDPSHNAKVGGAKGSQHQHGKAYDIDVRGMPIPQRQELIRKAREAGFSGIGVYENSLHFDVGGQRNWGPDYKSGSTPKWAMEALQTPTGQLEVDTPKVLAVEMQELLDSTAVQLGPQEANKQIVASVILSATEQRDPSLLRVLDNLQAGSGSLGKIGWVRQQVMQAQEQITNLKQAEEARSYAQATREREAVSRQAQTDAYRMILDNPLADATPLVQQMLDNNDPDGAKTVQAFAQKMREDTMDVTTAPEIFSHAKQKILNANSEAAIADMERWLMDQTGISVSKADANTLYNDLNDRKRFSGVYGDGEISNMFTSVNKVVADRFKVTDTMFGTEKYSGITDGLNAQDAFRDALLAYHSEHPDVSDYRLRDEARRIMRDVLQRPEFQKPTTDPETRRPTPYGEQPAQPDQAPALQGDTIPDAAVVQALSANPEGLEAYARSLNLTTADLFKSPQQ